MTLLQTPGHVPRPHPRRARAVIVVVLGAALCLLGLAPASAAAQQPAPAPAAAAAAGGPSAQADIRVGLNRIWITLTPQEQKELLQGGVLGGAWLGVEACIAFGYGIELCAIAGALIAAVVIAYIQDKVSVRCSLEVELDWAFTPVGIQYPNCPDGPF